MERRPRVLVLAGSSGLDTSEAIARFDLDEVPGVAELLARIASSDTDVVLLPAEVCDGGLIRRVREAAGGSVRVVTAITTGREPDAFTALDADDHLFLPAGPAEVALRLAGVTRVAADPIRDMVRTLPGVVYRCENDANWTMRLISDEIEHITGYPAASFVDNRVRSYASIIHRDDRARVEQEVADGLATNGDFGCEYRLIRSDGEIVWVLERGRRVRSTGGHLVLDGLLFEITDRKRAQRELRASMTEQAAVQAVTEERGRLARELHDSVGHALSVIALQAGAATANLPEASGPAATAVATIGTVIAETLDEMDHLLSRLHDVEDTAVPRRGVADLQTLVGRVRAAGVPASLTIDGVTERLAPDVDATCYRVVQEGLTNALKHAPEAPIVVTVALIDDRIDVTVRNDAPGPGRSLETWGSGRGLDGLRLRAAELGGALTASPRPDGGFELHASMPRELTLAADGTTPPT